jgi:hypothetical protein
MKMLSNLLHVNSESLVAQPVIRQTICLQIRITIKRAKIVSEKDVKFTLRNKGRRTI